MFQTEELGLTIVLLMVGFNGKVKWEHGKCYFVFTDTDDLQKAVKQYYWTRGRLVRKAKSIKSSSVTTEANLEL